MSLPYKVVQFTQGTREWLEWRHGGIGASEAPAIMGENPWRTAIEVLREKKEAPQDRGQNSAMARGARLEPEARAHYEEHVGFTVSPLCLQSTRHPWLRASLDGISDDRSSIVEIKCGESVYRKTATRRRVPDYYHGQLQHIMAVTGLEAIDFWCYLPGRPEVLVTVERDEHYIDRLIVAEEAFWEEVIG